MASAAPAPACHVHIEALQTAMPTRSVEPGRARPVTVVAPALTAAALQRRTRVVLYYRAAANADASSAPWIPEEALLVKESLQETVADHPEMAGRLRRRARADGSGSTWEVKLNDTGVRLVLATVDAAVDDFVGAGVGEEDRDRREAALASWTAVDADDPDMCPLCFVQGLDDFCMYDNVGELPSMRVVVDKEHQALSGELLLMKGQDIPQKKNERAGHVVAAPILQAHMSSACCLE